MYTKRLISLMLVVTLMAQPVSAIATEETHSHTSSSSNIEISDDIGNIEQDKPSDEIPSEETDKGSSELPEAQPEAQPGQPDAVPEIGQPGQPGQPGRVLDSGYPLGISSMPPNGYSPPPTPEWRSDEKTQDPDWNCWFGCTHAEDQDHWFPAVEVVYPDLSKLRIPNGRTRAATLIDLTDTASGGAASLACIWSSGYDAGSHYQSCINHTGSGVWNGTSHSNGKRNIQGHTMPSWPPSLSCTRYIALPTRACNGGCGYSEVAPESWRLPHAPSPTSGHSFPDAYAYTYCNRPDCGNWISSERCQFPGIDLPSCPNKNPFRALCQHGYMYDTTQVHCSLNDAPNFSCASCGWFSGLTYTFLGTSYNPDGTITWKTRYYNANKSLYNSHYTTWLAGATLIDRTATWSGTTLDCTEILRPWIPGQWITGTTTLAYKQENFPAHIMYYRHDARRDPPTKERPNIITLTSVATGTSSGGYAGGRTLNTTLRYNFDTNLQVALMKSDGVTAVSNWATITSSTSNFNYSTALNITSNGETYILRARDLWNNESQTSIVIPKTDSAAPTMGAIPDLTSGWAKTRTANFSATDNGGVGSVQIAFNQESDYQVGAVSGNYYTRDYTFTGDVYNEQTRPVYIKDALGNARSYPIKINRIDNTRPTVTTANVSYNAIKTNATIAVSGHDNHATLGAGSGITQYAITTTNTAPTSGWQAGSSFTVTSNANYYVWVKDTAGNISLAKTANVTGIDRISPLVSSAVVSTSWARENTVTVTGTDENSGISGYALTTVNTAPTSGWQTNGGFTVTSNGAYYGWIKDKAGNVSIGKTVTVNRVDRELPLITNATITPTGWHGTNKLITITGTDTGSGIKEYRLAQSGATTISNTTGKFSVSAGSYTVSIADNANNISATKVLLVDKIDLGPPTVQSVTTREQWATTEVVTIAATDTESGIKEYALTMTSAAPSSGWQSGNAFTVQANGKYWAWVRDNAGNTTAGNTVTVSKVDRDNPVVTSVVSDPAWNTSNKITVVATDITSGISGYALTTTSAAPNSGWQTNNSFTVTVNGDYWVWAKDLAGNVSVGVKVNVSTVDREVPLIGSVTVERAQDWTPGNKVVKVTGSDVGSGIKEFWAVHSDGTRLANNTGMFSTKMGTWTIGITDKVNNQSVTQLITVVKIDLNKPVISKVDVDANWAQSINIAVTAQDPESGIAGYAITTTNTAPTSGWQAGSSFTVTSNANYYAWVKDTVENVSLGSLVTVDKVDRVIPEVTAGTTDPIKVKQATITVTAKDSTGLNSDPIGTVVEYALTTTNTAPTSGWQVSPVFEVSEQKDYWLWAKDHADNVSLGFKYRPTQMWYDFKVEFESQGSVGVVPTSGLSKEIMEVVPNPTIGYALDTSSVRLNGETLIDIDSGKEGYQFKMPEKDSIVTFKFYPIVYQVEIKPSSDGTVTADRSTATVEDEVTLTITPDIGRHLVKDSLKYNGRVVPGVVYDGYNPTSAKFRMLPENVAVTAEFGVTVYTNIDGCNPTQGKITFSPQTAAMGDTITIYPTTEPGWRMIPGSLRANDKMVFNNEYKMPASDVTITASFIQVAYTVKAAEQEGGKVTVSHDEAMWLQNVNVSAVANPGWELSPEGFSVNGKKINGDSFLVKGNSIVSAIFTGLPQKLTVKVKGGGGSAQVQKAEWNTGEMVQVEIKPDPGWVIDSMQLNGEETTSEFKMPPKASEFEIQFIPLALTGTVKDTAERAIAKAQVRLTSGAYRKTVQSDSLGVWAVGRLQDGQFTITASHYKYNTSSVKITVKDGKVTDRSKLDIILDRDSEVERVEDLIDKLNPDSSAEDIFEVKKEYDDLENKSQVDKDKLDKLNELLKKVIEFNTRVESNIKDTKAEGLQHSVSLAGIKLDSEKLKSNVELILSVEETSTPVTSDAAIIKAFYDKNKHLGIFLDINLLVKVDSNPAYRVHEADAPITVKMPVPNGVEGSEFRIVRVHNGVAEYLTTKVHNGTIEFTTDRFSTYAMEFKPGTGIANEEIPGDTPDVGEEPDSPDPPSRPPNRPSNGSTTTGGNSGNSGNKGNKDEHDWNKPIEISPNTSTSSSSSTVAIDSEKPEHPQTDKESSKSENPSSKTEGNVEDRVELDRQPESPESSDPALNAPAPEITLAIQRKAGFWIAVGSGTIIGGGLIFWLLLLFIKRKREDEDSETDNSEEHED